MTICNFDFRFFFKNSIRRHTNDPHCCLQEMMYRSRPSLTWSFINFLSHYLASFRFFFLSKYLLFMCIHLVLFFLSPSIFYLYFCFFCFFLHIFIYFCYPLFLANLSFQNMFINLLSFWVSLIIQTFKTF